MRSRTSESDGLKHCICISFHLATGTTSHYYLRSLPTRAWHTVTYPCPPQNNIAGMEPSIFSQWVYICSFLFLHFPHGLLLARSYEVLVRVSSSQPCSLLHITPAAIVNTTHNFLSSMISLPSKWTIKEIRFSRLHTWTLLFCIFEMIYSIIPSEWFSVCGNSFVKQQRIPHTVLHPVNE